MNQLVVVLLAAVAAFVIGFLWYGPLFGKQWVALMGFSKKQQAEMKKKPMAPLAGLEFLASLVMAYFLSFFIQGMGATTVGSAMLVSLYLAIGFFLTAFLGGVLWEGKKPALYFFNSAYWMVKLVVMGAVIAAL